MVLVVNMSLAVLLGWIVRSRALALRVAPAPWIAAVVVVYFVVGYVVTVAIEAAFFMRAVAPGTQLSTMSVGVRLAVGLGAGLLAAGVVAFGLLRSRGSGAEQTPDRPRQLVGLSCVACGERIVVQADGTECSHCHEPVHTRCGRAHRCSEDR